MSRHVWRILLTLSLLLAFLTLPALPFSLTLKWDPPDAPNLDTLRYRVYISQDGRYYIPLESVGTTECTVDQLEDGRSYYFKVTAVNEMGIESADSNIVSYEGDIAGDINNNKRLDIADLLLLRIKLNNIASNFTTSTSLFFWRGDLNENGRFDAQDEILMEKMLTMQPLDHFFKKQ